MMPKGGYLCHGALHALLYAGHMLLVLFIQAKVLKRINKMCCGFSLERQERGVWQTLHGELAGSPARSIWVVFGVLDLVPLGVTLQVHRLWL
jgi:hypothetical protein